MADWLTALSTFGLLGVTVLLAFYAKSQVSELKAQLIESKMENKKWKTLDICNLYDTNPIIDTSARKIKSANLSGEILKDGVNLRTDATTILNYLDSIAIGINQNLYIESLAKDHMRNILMFYVESLIKNEATRSALDLKVGSFRNLIEIYNKWNPELPQYSSN